MVERPVGGRKRPLYKLKDYNGEELSGTFYPEEIQKINENKYYIESILKRRKLSDGTKQIFVKWEGWSSKFNSWINDDDTYDGSQN